MPGVPAAGAADHVVTAGPLRATVGVDGELRIGWEEPDWLGPARLSLAGAHVATDIDGSGDAIRLTAGWLGAEVRALDGEPVVVLRLEAQEARGDLATSGFATPA